MRIPSKGEIVRTDTAYPGEIVILPSDSVRLTDVLGDPTRLPRKRWREDPLPMLRTTIAPKTAAQRERPVSYTHLPEKAEQHKKTSSWNSYLYGQAGAVSIENDI